MGLALYAVAAAELEPLWKGLLLLGCAIYVIYGMKAVVSPSIRGIKYLDRQWSLWDEKKGWCPIAICHDTTLTPICIILRYRSLDGGRTRSLYLFKDAMNGDAHRHLRVHLKFAH